MFCPWGGTGGTGETLGTIPGAKKSRSTTFRCQFSTSAPTDGFPPLPGTATRASLPSGTPSSESWSKSCRVKLFKCIAAGFATPMSEPDPALASAELAAALSECFAAADWQTSRPTAAPELLAVLETTAFSSLTTGASAAGSVSLPAVFAPFCLFFGSVAAALAASLTASARRTSAACFVSFARSTKPTINACRSAYACLMTSLSVFMSATHDLTTSSKLAASAGSCSSTANCRSGRTV
mmetsp:Transcript_87118/g.154171  ORF Transcript_87118/g.154171 Transcript_87118/m.154171 type:complete len:239 (-) Transcript_87118:2212-2928(-)